MLRTQEPSNVVAAIRQGPGWGTREVDEGEEGSRSLGGMTDAR